MIKATRSAGRKTHDYVKLSRWVYSNHYKTEKTKPKEGPPPNPISRFLHNRIFLWAYHYIKSRIGPRHKFMAYPEQGEQKGIYQMECFSDRDFTTIALVSDWATDTEESRAIGLKVDKHEADYTIHLGDTYFVGTHKEIQQSFDPANSFWPYGEIGSFALPGNHEMYSNGDPYYHSLLPWMGLHYPKRLPQQASYVCLENDYWRIIGLDTGYRSVSIPLLEMMISHADLHHEELEWLNHDLKLREDNRGLIFLTHHQNVSSFSRNYPVPGQQLGEIIGSDRKVLWFWGHEHRFAMYGKYAPPDGVSSYGRCIGHGGMPIDLEKHPEKIKPDEKNLVLYDNRPRTQINNTDLGHNGYALLKIDQANLEVEYYDEHQMLVAEQWVYNTQTKSIEGKDIKAYHDQLEKIRDIQQAIL
jgi:hypothetical protein